MSRREATSMVEVGTMAAEALAAESAVDATWFERAADATSPASPLSTDSDVDDRSGGDVGAAPAGGPGIRAPEALIGVALARGELTVAHAEAVRSGIGSVDDPVVASTLAAALPMLLEHCRSQSPELARRAARQLRESVDVAYVATRAAARQDSRFWRVWVKPDGMVRGEFELEPASGMLVKAVFDRLAHPRHVKPKVRRGFGDPVVGDDRYRAAKATRERRAAEGLVQLLRAGASVDPGRVLDERRPSVRLIVNASVLVSGHGTGLIEGHPDRVPLGDIRAGFCDGYLPIRFDAGAPIDLGRDERFFTAKQKTVLAVRDGGCLDPDCDRPPSWTEAHHIDHWQRDGGKTDLADAVNS